MGAYKVLYSSSSSSSDDCDDDDDDDDYYYYCTDVEHPVRSKQLFVPRRDSDDESQEAEDVDEERRGSIAEAGNEELDVSFFAVSFNLLIFCFWSMRVTCDDACLSICKAVRPSCVRGNNCNVRYCSQTCRLCHLF